MTVGYPTKLGRVLQTLVLVIATGVSSLSAAAQEKPKVDPVLEESIVSLRNVDPDKLSDEEKDRKVAEIEKAWKTIKAAGNHGRDRIKQELNTIDREKAKDDFFKLNAAALLWEMAKLEESETIAAIWRSARLDAQCNYVFYTAYEAAQTQDPRVLPMLKAILRDDKGGTFVPAHSLQVTWPLNHMVIWESFGPKGLPALLEVLERSQDPVELSSAIILLSRAQYLDALPRIRELARTGKGRPRVFAIEYLGEFGHPLDFDFLLAGLNSQDGDIQAAHVRALAAYEDLRAVPSLIKTLKDKDEQVRNLSIDALATLITPDSLEALHERTQSADGAPSEEGDACRKIVDRVLSRLELNWETYAGKSGDERAAMLAAADKREERYRLKEDDRKLSSREFFKATKDWKKRHRITGGDYEWVEDRHVLAVATPKDLDRLLEVRAALYARLSDECLYEVDTLNGLLHRIGRSRYREGIGLCPQVKEKTDMKPARKAATQELEDD